MANLRASCTSVASSSCRLAQRPRARTRRASGLRRLARSRSPQRKRGEPSWGLGAWRPVQIEPQCLLLCVSIPPDQSAQLDQSAMHDSAFKYGGPALPTYKLVLKDKTRPSITQNGSHAPPEHPGTHTRAQNDLAGPGSGARYAVVGHPEVDFRPFRSKVPLNLN